MIGVQLELDGVADRSGAIKHREQIDIGTVSPVGGWSARTKAGVPRRERSWM
jgi:hypothetical protein